MTPSSDSDLGGNFIQLKIEYVKRKLILTSLPFFFSYDIGSILALLPAKQRVRDPNDWMFTDAETACPDPYCKSRLKIQRVGLRTFRHSEVTVVPLTSKHDEASL